MAKSMGSKAGLTRKKVQVRLKSGKTIQRSMMVRAGDAVKSGVKRVGGFVNRHKGKIAGAAALAGAAYLGHKGLSRINKVNIGRAQAGREKMNRQEAVDMLKKYVTSQGRQGAAKARATGVRGANAAVSAAGAAVRGAQRVRSGAVGVASKFKNMKNHGKAGRARGAFQLQSAN